MAIFSGAVRSSVLAMDTGLTVFLPHDRPAEVREDPCKALYLLHGLGDNHSTWLRHTAIERYARAKGVAVVMPEVQRSFYSNMAYGIDYFTYITDELPQMCSSMFRIGGRRENTYVAGLSMGGYGALKCGLTYPDRYAGCASFSGAVDLAQLAEHYLGDKNIDESRGIFGMDLEIDPANDLLHLSSQVARLPGEQRPKIFFTCGTEDFLFGINVDFQTHLESVGLDFTCRFWPGDHVWPFWDESVRQLLEEWF